MSSAAGVVALTPRPSSGFFTKTAALLVVAATLGAAPAASQSPDSLVALLGATEWQSRHDAIARLNLLPVDALPSSFPSTAIALLEHEATHPDPGPREGEGYGEYTLALMQSVLRLDDPRALRGMALLGMKTSRRAKEFVAKQGGAALPYLDQAWARDSFARPDVMTTWGYMLGPYGRALSPADSLVLMARLVRGAREQPLGFAWAVGIATAFETVPVLDVIAATNAHAIVRRRAADVSATLRRGRDAVGPTELVRRLNLWLKAVCQNPAGARPRACDSLTDLSAEVLNQLRADRTQTGAAALDTLIRVADAAPGAGGLDEPERTLVVGTGRYIRSRL